MCGPQDPVVASRLHLQRPVLHLDVFSQKGHKIAPGLVWTTGACVALGRVYSTGAGAASGLVCTPVPEFIDPDFAKASPKRSFSVIENERFGLVFAKTGSINSGTGVCTAPRRVFTKGPECTRTCLHYRYSTCVAPGPAHTSGVQIHMEPRLHHVFKNGS